MKYKRPYINEGGESFCPKCKDVPGDFIPLCDFHEKHPDQRESMHCDDCLLCCNCNPRKWMDELGDEINARKK